MNSGGRVSCVLCSLSKETGMTGPLSTKQLVTAHQNCLLFSSGIYCQNSPQFDDLFGFTVQDVQDEVKRGRKLCCHRCKKRGATAGCEEKRCKRSYHYPCAVEEGAEIIEDSDKGKYGLYCLKHHQQRQDNGVVNGHASSSANPTTSENSSEARSSKVFCPVCEKTEGYISLESLTNNIVTLYCDKHAPLSYKRNDDRRAARSSVYTSDSNSSSSLTCPKRRLSFRDQQEQMPNRRRRISDSSSNSDENEPTREFAPLESDIDESANSVPEQQFIGNDSEIPTGSNSGNQPESRDGKKDDEYVIDSDAESESLLYPAFACKEPQSLPPGSATTSNAMVVLVKTGDMGKKKDGGDSPEQRPVHIPLQHTAGSSAPQQSSTGAASSPGHSKPHNVTGSPPRTNAGISPDPPEVICVSVLSSPSPSPVTCPSEPSIDSVSFWKSCRKAGCAQAIFADFINEMNNISSRIQSDQASQEDYDLALTVMTASGKLSELVAKQQKELQRKQSELTKAAAAMKEIVSALRR